MELELLCQLPGKRTVVFPMSQATILIGTLPSNQLILPVNGVSPIHALLENVEGRWVVTDLGSELGVYVNGKAISVESEVKNGDNFKIGAVTLEIRPYTGQKLTLDPQEFVDAEPESFQQKISENAEKKLENQQTYPRDLQKKDTDKKAEKPSSTTRQERRVSENMLFSPRTSVPAGDVLEVVSYWGDSILEVEHFQKGKNQAEVKIGDTQGNHFLSGGIEFLASHTLGKVVDDGYAVDLIEGMTARLRRGKKAENVGAGTYLLQQGDICHVTHGAIRYFFIFRRPPVVEMPKEGPQDPFFLALLSVGMFLYLVLGATLYSLDYKPKETEHQDLWAVVDLPEKPKPQPPVPQSKPEVKLEEAIKPPPPKEVPPPPPPAPVKPVEPQEPPKPVEVKTELQQKVETKPIERLNPPTPQTQQQPVVPPQAVAVKKPTPAAGTNSSGAPRAGKAETSVPGNPQVKNDKPAGMNLSSLGLGVGKISSKSGVGAISSKFVNSAGSAGGGSGSAPTTLGLGGVGTSKTLGLAGALTSTSQFGGGGGVVSGNATEAFKAGRKSADVNVGAGDPLIAGSVSQEQVMAVIKANLSQIRNCYEKLLQSSPNAQGDVTVRFVVGSAGQVTGSNVTEATLTETSLHKCITSTIMRWKFPKPTGTDAVVVTYPFTFNPI